MPLVVDVDEGLMSYPLGVEVDWMREKAWVAILVNARRRLVELNFCLPGRAAWRPEIDVIAIDCCKVRLEVTLIKFL